MAKEWILNSAMNRYKLNQKQSVGATSESIRNCSPKSIDEWRTYYYANVRTEEHIEELAKRLYVKITEVIQSEVAEVTEQDCIDYMKEMVIDRTYKGYCTEIETIYGQLQQMLGVSIVAAPDEWDRHYNVDFYILVNGKYIGLQIKPVNKGLQLPEIHKEYAQQKASHKNFRENFGGNVFYIYSVTVDRRKVIANPEVVDAIQEEINNLSI